MRRQAAISALAIFSALILHHDSLAQGALAERASIFYNAWQTGDPKPIWDILSPDIKEYTDFDTYSINLKMFFGGTRLTGFRIRRVNESDKEATVDTDVVLVVVVPGEAERSDRAPHAIETIDRTRWVRRQAIWYLATKPRVLE